MNVRILYQTFLKIGKLLKNLLINLTNYMEWLEVAACCDNGQLKKRLKFARIKVKRKGSSDLQGWRHLNIWTPCFPCNIWLHSFRPSWIQIIKYFIKIIHQKQKRRKEKKRERERMEKFISPLISEYKLVE